MQEYTPFIQAHGQLFIALACVLLMLILIELFNKHRAKFALSAAGVTQLVNHEKAVIVDIRDNVAYKSGHIINALSVPATSLDNTKKLLRYQNQPVILVCNTGIDAIRSATLLQNQGFTVYTLAGGIKAWTDSNLPLVKE
jgi:rhodanese-related sulfurtransferase